MRTQSGRRRDEGTSRGGGYFLSKDTPLPVFCRIIGAFVVLNLGPSAMTRGYSSCIVKETCLKAETEKAARGLPGGGGGGQAARERSKGLHYSKSRRGSVWASFAYVIVMSEECRTTTILDTRSIMFLEMDKPLFPIEHGVVRLMSRAKTT